MAFFGPRPPASAPGPRPQNTVGRLCAAISPVAIHCPLFFLTPEPILGGGFPALFSFYPSGGSLVAPGINRAFLARPSGPGPKVPKPSAPRSRPPAWSGWVRTFHPFFFAFGAPAAPFGIRARPPGAVAGPARPPKKLPRKAVGPEAPAFFLGRPPPRTRAPAIIEGGRPRNRGLVPPPPPSRPPWQKAPGNRDQSRALLLDNLAVTGLPPDLPRAFPRRAPGPPKARFPKRGPGMPPPRRPGDLNHPITGKGGPQQRAFVARFLFLLAGWRARKARNFAGLKTSPPACPPLLPLCPRGRPPASLLRPAAGWGGPPPSQPRLNRCAKAAEKLHGGCGAGRLGPPSPRPETRRTLPRTRLPGRPTALFRRLTKSFLLSGCCG